MPACLELLTVAQLWNELMAKLSVEDHWPLLMRTLKPRWFLPILHLIQKPSCICFPEHQETPIVLILTTLESPHNLRYFIRLHPFLSSTRAEQSSMQPWNYIRKPKASDKKSQGNPTYGMDTLFTHVFFSLRGVNISSLAMLDDSKLEQKEFVPKTGYDWVTWAAL